MQNPKGLGELIKELRVEKNLSQKELAEKCGLTQQAINRIEHNQRNIEFGLLLKFTKVLDLSIPDLIEAGIKLEPDEIALLDTLINTHKWGNQEDTEKDVEKIIKQTEKQLSQDGLILNGNPATPEAINSIVSAMQIGVELAKKKNK